MDVKYDIIYITAKGGIIMLTNYVICEDTLIRGRIVLLEREEYEKEGPFRYEPIAGSDYLLEAQCKLESIRMHGVSEYLDLVIERNK